MYLRHDATAYKLGQKGLNGICFTDAEQSIAISCRMGLTGYGRLLMSSIYNTIYTATLSVSQPNCMMFNHVYNVCSALTMTLIINHQSMSYQLIRSDSLRVFVKATLTFLE